MRFTEFFKDNADKQEKLAEISKYSMLDTEVLKEFVDNVDTYTMTNLQDALKVAYVNANANTIFSGKTADDQLIFNLGNQEGELTGAAKLINNHKKNGGNK